MTDPIRYPSVEDVLAIHEDVVSEYDDTPAGVRTRGDVAFTLHYVERAGSGTQPEGIHDRAFHLLRLLVANHPFVDANKRTALNATAVFYLFNGFRFAYDDGIRSVLRAFATDEADVDRAAVLEYLRRHTGEVDPAEGIGETGQEFVRRVAAAYREEHRDVYDALEDE